MNRVCIALLLLAGIPYTTPQQALGQSDPAGGARPAERVREVVQEVLADPEYRHLLRDEDEPREEPKMPEWLREFLKWLFGGEETYDANPSTFDLENVLFYGAMTLLVVLIVVLLVGLVLRYEWTRSDSFSADATGEEAIEPTQPPGDIPTNEYERRALAAADSGDYRSALRELVLGSMSWVERAGMIRYRLGLTNRDYIRAIWRLEQKRDSLLNIVAAFERVFYGRRPADVSTFDECLAQFRRSFSQEAGDAHLEN